MSLQIREIVLYHYSGELRRIGFRRGQLNIITGSSKTGKSSIIDILEYCTGKGSCAIAEGIQRAVSWFGVFFANGSDAVFVARKSPEGSTTPSSAFFFQRRVEEAPPDYLDLMPNISGSDLVDALSRWAGIRSNQVVNNPASTRTPFSASFRHALRFCIQAQNDIANRGYLFRGQDDHWVAQELSHTLPFFVGAMDEKMLTGSAELSLMDTKIRQLKRKNSQRLDLGDIQSELSAAIDQAKGVGLIDRNEEALDLQASVDLLRRIAASGNDALDQSAGESGSLIDETLDIRRTLRASLEEIRKRKRDARVARQTRRGFQAEMAEQESRLNVVSLFQTVVAESNVCPLCESELSHSDPTLAAIHMSLIRTRRHIEAARDEMPDFDHLIVDLTSREEEVLIQLHDNQIRLRALSRIQLESQGSTRDEVQQARVLGRIDKILESLDEPNSSMLNDAGLASLEAQADELRTRLSFDQIETRLDSFASLMSNELTELAREVDLEYSLGRVRFDPRKLSVIADTVNGPVEMERMGSAENWLGYHLVTHLALHRWFQSHSLPVPGFIVFDQPSQAHFPTVHPNDSSSMPIPDEDTKAVSRIFKMVYDLVDELSPVLQVIIVDHANLQEEWFADSVIEEWGRDTGIALVPTVWM